MKKKLLLDLFLFILMILLMNYSFVGGSYHEWLGLIIFILFIWHNYKNIIWLKRVTINLWKGDIKSQILINYIIDACLWISLITVTISGIVISKSIFTFMNFNYSNTWYTVHFYSAYILISLIIIHVLLHFKMVIRFLERQFEVIERRKIKYASLIIFLSLSFLCFKNIIFKDTISYTNNSSKVTNEGSSDSIESQTQDDEETYDSSSSTSDESYTNNNSSGDTPTLTEFLSQRNCSNCGRHCPLSAISCGRGTSAKSAATSEYNELYGN